MLLNGKNEAGHLINNVSQRVGLSQKRIREYEKAGLIRPAREPKTNNRRYTEADIRQIQRIKALIHEFGFTLACLKYFLATAPCWIIFDCAKKENCPAYRIPYTACYEIVIKDLSHKEMKDCKRCPVYLNRNEQKIAILAKND